LVLVCRRRRRRRRLGSFATTHRVDCFVVDD